MNQPLLQTFRE